MTVRDMPPREYARAMQAAARDYPEAALLDHSGAARVIVEAFILDPTGSDTTALYVRELICRHLERIIDAENGE